MIDVISTVSIAISAGCLCLSVRIYIQGETMSALHSRRIGLMEHEQNELIQRMDNMTVAANKTFDSMRTSIESLETSRSDRDEWMQDLTQANKDSDKRLLELERAHADNKGPVQARGVVASRRAIMEMGGAKDLM